MNLESFHNFSKQNKYGSVTVQCQVFRQCVQLHHVRILRHGHDQEEFDRNYLKYVPVHDSSSIIGIKLNHILWARADSQVDNHQIFLHYCPVLGT